MKKIFVFVIIAIFALSFSCCNSNSKDTDIQITSSEIEKYEETASEERTQLYIENFVKNNYSEELVILAKIAYVGARGIESKTEQACVIWTVLNRYDSGNWGKTLKEVATAPKQFGYNDNAPMIDDYGRDLYLLAVDVLSRWYREKYYGYSVGRVLPSNYFYISGDGAHNYFTEEYGSKFFWDYSYSSPYEAS